MRRVDSLPVGVLATLGALLIWLSQPPLGVGLFAWFAYVPWLIIASKQGYSLRDGITFFFVAVTYWAITMQGIRHAHPAMYAALAAFAIYLACYSVAFVWLIRHCVGTPRFGSHSWILVPVFATGLECIRNYLLTGISAVMIGHTQVNFPLVVQIADAFGSYGVTFLVMLVNAAIWECFIHTQREGVSRFYPIAIASICLIATVSYGQWRIVQGDRLAEQNRSEVSLALIGRDEEIVFIQDAQRDLEIFNAYFRESIQAADEVAKSNDKLDAIIWPESVYTGGLPWILKDNNLKNVASIDPIIMAVIDENRVQFQRRSAQVQAAIKRVTGQSNDPHLLVGCTVIGYHEPPKVYNGMIHVGERGRVVDWYGKTHLVMFGEYIPLIEYLPWIDRIVPPGMGVERGKSPVAMQLDTLTLSPNVCIETAIERVTLQHVVELAERGNPPDVIVNVTNDGWFDRTSIVEHHLRCSQMVAIGCRRPIVMAANGGPTAWIDSAGRVVKRLRNDENGSIIANIVVDGRWGLYQRIGDWPARLLAAICIGLMLGALVKRFKRRGAGE